MDNNGLSDVFIQTIKDSLQPNENLLKTQNIYSELHGLRGLFITTNIDELFDDHFDRSQIIYQGFNDQDIDTSKLYHIHGSVFDWNSVVLTVKQYFDRYNDSFREFLIKIFKDNDNFRY